MILPACVCSYNRNCQPSLSRSLQRLAIFAFDKTTISKLLLGDNPIYLSICSHCSIVKPSILLLFPMPLYLGLARFIITTSRNTKSTAYIYRLTDEDTFVIILVPLSFWYLSNSSLHLAPFIFLSFIKPSLPISHGYSALSRSMSSLLSRFIFPILFHPQLDIIVIA
jgi:hypothetical protein